MFVVNDSEKAVVPGFGERKVWELKDNVTNARISRVEHKEKYRLFVEDGSTVVIHELHPADSAKYPKAEFMISLGDHQQFHPDFQLLPARRRPRSKYILEVGSPDPSDRSFANEIRVQVDLHKL